MNNSQEAAHESLRFPGGRRKALIMSYDDGSEHDRRLVEIFNRCGIRGTFHLNSAKLGQPHFVRPDEVTSLYRGHEVSCHTRTHPYLVGLPDDSVRREIIDDRHALHALCGQSARGLAYPFGSYDERVVRIVRDLGVAYARTAESTMSLAVPSDLLAWRPSCHHNAAMDLAQSFLDESRGEPTLLLVWGHSYELDGFMCRDPAKNWDYMDALCGRLHGRPSVWYATALEVAEYLEAMRKVEVATECVRNVSNLPVWLEWRGSTIELAPGATT